MYSVTRLATVGLDDIIVRVVVTSIMPPLFMIIMQQELNCSSKSFIQSHACKLQYSKNEIGKFLYNQNDVNLGFSRWVYAEKVNKILQPESWSIDQHFSQILWGISVSKVLLPFLWTWARKQWDVGKRTRFFLFSHAISPWSSWTYFAVS